MKLEGEQRGAGHVPLIPETLASLHVLHSRETLHPKPKIIPAEGSLHNLCGTHEKTPCSSVSSKALESERCRYGRREQ